MTDRLDLPRRYREQLEALLSEHVPGVEVWAYGSRVNGRSHEASDLDLVLRGPEPGTILGALASSTCWRRYGNRASPSWCRRTIGRDCPRAFTGKSRRITWWCRKEKVRKKWTG